MIKGGQVHLMQPNRQARRRARAQPFWGWITYGGADAMRRLINFAIALTLILAWSTSGSAQETTGTLQGRIVDTQGLAVPGATVTAAGPQGTKTTVSGEEGRFSIPFLVPGSYVVRVELQGFKAAEQKDVSV